jgi:citrate lyase subunit beta / citryl-CoA lyase
MLQRPESDPLGLGGRHSRHEDGRYRDVTLHADRDPARGAARERAAVDAVYLDIGDQDGLANEARDAADSGFAMKACIDPSQVSLSYATRSGQSHVRLNGHAA